MAYREFHYEKHYEAPNTDRAYDVQVQGITNLFRGLQQKQEQRRKASDQFQYDLDQGAFENDTKILTEVAKNVTNRAKNELRNGGKLSVDTELLMKDGGGWQQQSKNQLERAKQLRQVINDKAAKDSYYNPEPDQELITEATHGKDNDVDFRTRGERLSEAEKRIGGIDTFKFNKYRADYVKEIGSQLKERETPLKSGGSRTEYNQATFWDDEKGVPAVTDKHAIRFLESDARLGQYYDDKVERELEQEIKSMRSSKDTRTSWMDDLSDEEVKLELINNPDRNLINNKEFGARIRDKAKADLEEADRINSKVSYTNISGDKNNSGGRWSNQNILHENSINSFAQEAKNSDGQMNTVNTYGPGGRITQKSGRPIQIDTTNPVRTNTDKGITTSNNKGNLRFNLTGYQLMPQKSKGAPFALKSNTVEGMMKEINELPLEYFDPKGNMALKPKMAVGLNGYTINEAGVLNDIQDQLVDLSSQIATAKKDKNTEEVARLENMEYELGELKNMIGSGDYDQQDLILAGNKAGVRKIQQNYTIPAQDSDFATIKNTTGGLDLRDKSFWSPEMQQVEEAYEKRYNEAKEKGFGKTQPKEEEKKTTTIVTVTTQEDYAKLPSGSEYIGPDGKKRRKK